MEKETYKLVSEETADGLWFYYVEECGYKITPYRLNKDDCEADFQLFIKYKKNGPIITVLGERKA